MDPTFQSLLFTGSSSGGGGANSSNGVAGSNGEVGINGNGDVTRSANRGILRPSRYATLIPQERLVASSSSPSSNDRVHNNNNNVNGGDTNKENVRVCRRNNEGVLELLPEDDYDLVYYTDDGDVEADAVQEVFDTATTATSKAGGDDVHDGNTTAIVTDVAVAAAVVVS